MGTCVLDGGSPAINLALRRNARLETLAVFAQSIYLIFASVYVCKEAVEHMLLSHGEGHHHHRGDDTDLGYVLWYAYCGTLC